MKVVYYIPAHPSYFDNAYSIEDIEQAIDQLKYFYKPDKLGEIPEEFIFVAEAGKNLNPVFFSEGMNAPDPKTEARWIESTDKLARGACDHLIGELKKWLDFFREKRKS